MQSRARFLKREIVLLLVIPLVIATLICVLVTAVALYATHTSWTKDVEDYLLQSEIGHTSRMVQARCNSFQIFLNSYFRDCNFMVNLIEGAYHDTLHLNPDLQDPKNVNMYDDLQKQKRYPQYGEAMWLSSDSTIRRLPDDPKLKRIIQVADPYLRVLWESKREVVYQIGFILEEWGGFEYRYPLREISYITQRQNYQDTCERQNAQYDPLCKPQYYHLMHGKYSDKLVLISFERDFMTFFYKIQGLGAVTFYIRYKTVVDRMLVVDDFHFFIAQYQGDYVIAYDGQPFKDFQGKSLGEVIFPDSSELQDSLQTYLQNLSPLKHDVLTSSFQQILLSTYFVNLATTEESTDSSYICGVIVAEQITYHDYDEAIDSIYTSVILNTMAFFVLAIAGFALSMLIFNFFAVRLVYPVIGYIEFFKGRIQFKDIDFEYNEEMNTMAYYLGQVDIIRKFINPNYLVNPNLNKRKRHLKEAVGIFKNIDNLRGMAIAYNLRGNIEVLHQRYGKAIKYYSKAFDMNTILHDEILQQEIMQSMLEYTTWRQVKSKIGRVHDDWQQERRVVKQFRCQRIMQLVNAYFLQMYEYEDESGPQAQQQTWKRIKDLQTEALEYFLESRQQMTLIIRAILDLSLALLKCAYNQSAFDLLEVAMSLINKLEPGTEIDIDIIRIIRIGIELPERFKSQDFIIKVEPITFQKDLLIQRLLYYRGVIMMESRKPSEAAISYITLLVSFMQEQGKYYDPLIRRNAIKDVYMIFQSQGIISKVPEINFLYKVISAKQLPEIILVMYYDIGQKKLRNKAAQSLVENHIEANLVKFGVLTSYIHTNLSMQLVERDLPQKDLRQLIQEYSKTKFTSMQDHVYDIMMHGFNMYSRESKKKYMIVFMDKMPDFNFCATTEHDFAAFKMAGVRLIVLAFKDISPEFARVIYDQCEGKIVECFKKSFLSQAVATVAELLENE